MWLEDLHGVVRTLRGGPVIVLCCSTLQHDFGLDCSTAFLGQVSNERLDSIEVSTSLCGSDNPGSIPGQDIFFFNARVSRASAILTRMPCATSAPARRRAPLHSRRAPQRRANRAPPAPRHAEHSQPAGVQDNRTPFPTWYSEDRDSATPHMWCAYHANGAGAWVASGLFARHGRAGRHACTECAGPGLRSKPASDAATMEQCDAFAPCLSERRHSLWRGRRKGYDGAAAAEALRAAIGDPEESEESTTRRSNSWPSSVRRTTRWCGQWQP